MVIDLLYVPDCPNLVLARDRLRVALIAAGVDATIRETEISSPEGAARAGLRGSPTILVDRRDPFASPGDEPSVSCRLFDVDGAITGAPSVGQLVAALQATDPI